MLLLMPYLDLAAVSPWHGWLHLLCLGSILNQKFITALILIIIII